MARSGGVHRLLNESNSNGSHVMEVEVALSCWIGVRVPRTREMGLGL